MDTRNWGRWGPEDERGALNMLTPEVVLKAARLVQNGRVYPLGIPIQQRGQPMAGGRNPSLHLMALDGGDYAAGARLKGGFQAADDYLMMATHGSTHIDALAHAWYDNRLYNGHDPNRVRSYGATRCGIEKAGSVVGRGVLLDIAGSKGVEHLECGYVITPEDIEACCEREDVGVEQGDIVLFRTGWLGVFYRDPEEFEKGQPGIGVAAANWLLDRDVCAVGADNASVEANLHEVFDQSDPAPIVHKLLIRDNGVYMMELLALDEPAKARAYEFLFVAAPLRIVGGVGSPLNPLAIA